MRPSTVKAQTFSPSAIAFKSADGFGSALALFLLISFFLVLQSFLPPGTAIKIGADEDFELSKVTLVQKGYKLYTEVWNDQPPLYTFLLRQMTNSDSPKVLGPRLMTVCFSVLFLSSFFLIVFFLSSSLSSPASKTELFPHSAEPLWPARHSDLRTKGNCVRGSPLITATLATLFLTCSPGFLELSCSVMQEIPALAPILAAMAVLVSMHKSNIKNAKLKVVSAGFLFGAGLQLKLIGIIYVPLIFLILWGISGSAGLRTTTFSRCSPFRPLILDLVIFGMAVFVTFSALNFVTGSPLLLQLKQAWASHFTPPQTPEYGSAKGHGFEWTVLAKNWDVTVPAFLGLIFNLSSSFPILLASRVPDGTRRKDPEAAELSRHKLALSQMLPAVWLALTLSIFAMHKPWWAYYYIHNLDRVPDGRFDVC